MKNRQFNPIKAAWSPTVVQALPALALVLVAGYSSAAGKDREEWDMPDILRPPAGNVRYFHAEGVGVQIYVWTPNPANPSQGMWAFKAPHAVLFDWQDAVAVQGIHYLGPTWEADDGSTVVGTKLASVKVDPTAVPWLLLQATSNSGVGVFADTTYIQRVRTVGGVAPSTPGTFFGEEVLVPYSARYNFYHAGS